MEGKDQAKEDLTTPTAQNATEASAVTAVAKKKQKNQMKKFFALMKYVFYASIGMFLAISYYLPFIFQCIIAFFTAALLAVIYLPKKVDYRWEIKFMVAQGFELSQWMSYLVRHRFSVDPIYWHRVLFISFLSTFTTFFWKPNEEKKYPEEEVQKIEIKEDPIFVLGHFRSGTSLLHELLNKDEHLLAPTVYQCFAPRSFLTKEEEVMKMASNTMFKRPMDSMKIKLSSPQEDEFALTNLHGLSPYIGSLFPRDERKAVVAQQENSNTSSTSSYMRYLTLKNVPEEERTTWKNGLVWFYKKVLYKHQDKRLLLKSPTHTARIKIIKEIFPNAKFIHISRNPYEVFFSTWQKLFKQLIIQWNLQYFDYNCDETIDLILDMFGTMYDSHFEDREEFKLDGNDSNLVDVKYEELMEDPTGTISKIYNKLGLEGWEDIKPKIEEHQANQKKFKVNEHDELKPELKERVYQRMKHYFDAFGYKK